MSNAVMLDEKDVKKLIAEKYNVEENSIYRMQYSYVIKLKNENDSEKED